MDLSSLEVSPGRLTMTQPIVIRHKWPGFGDCEIWVAASGSSPRFNALDRVFASVATSASRLGLAKLRFVVDPSWIQSSDQAPAGQIASRFLRIHRDLLALELQSPGSSEVSVSSVEMSPVIPRSASIQEPAQVAVATTPVSARQSESSNPAKAGLPGWFRECCTAKQDMAGRA